MVLCYGIPGIFIQFLFTHLLCPLLLKLGLGLAPKCTKLAFLSELSCLMFFLSDVYSVYSHPLISSLLKCLFFSNEFLDHQLTAYSVFRLSFGILFWFSAQHFFDIYLLIVYLLVQGYLCPECRTWYCLLICH